MLKTSVRECKVPNADVTLVPLTLTLIKESTDGIKKKVLVELHALPDHWYSQISHDLAIFVLYF